MPFKSPLPKVPLETQPYGERMLDVLWRHGAANPTKKAIICAENPQFSVTYHELYHQSLSVAAFLDSNGFKKGDVLLTVLPNSWEFEAVLIGAALRGVVFSGSNPNYSEHDVDNQIRDSGATIIFCADDTLELVLKSTKDNDNIKKIVVAQISDRTKKLSINLSAKIASFDEVIATKPSAHTKPANIDVEKDLLLLPYSSGTTGPSKGVMISHQLFSTMITTISSHVSEHIYPHLNPTREVASENVLLGLPFCMIYGGATLQKALVLGQTVIAMHHFEEHCYLRSIQNYKIHYLFLVPTVIAMLANSPNVDKYDLSSVEAAMSSGAPASSDICHKALNRLPNFKRIDQGYGMTETSGPCTLLILDDPNVITAHSGMIFPSYEVKTVDINGVETPFGEPGELLLRSPVMMLGYLGRPEATANAFIDGWLRTGDLARVDANGIITIVGRLKEMIKSQYDGTCFPVQPAELEQILHSHADIVDAGVIGIPWNENEAIFAFIVRRNDNLCEKDVHEFINSKVAEYKQLKGGIRFVDAIPKSDTGKILRKALRDMYDNGV